MKGEEQDEFTPQNKNPWNKREQKSPILLYGLIVVVCLILAYVLSGTAK